MQKQYRDSDPESENTTMSTESASLRTTTSTEYTEEANLCLEAAMGVEGKRILVPENESQEDKAARRKRRLEAVHKKDKLEVSFSTLTIREYPIIVGDNPSSFKGAPLTIGWNFQSETTQSVDDFETNRAPRRYRLDLVLSASDRDHLLKEAGYARNELIALTRPVNISRNQRKQTNAMQHFDSWHEASEAITRKAFHVLTLGAKKREERKFLEEFLPNKRKESEQPLEAAN